ncbi:MAG: DUF3857 domain-containing protein [Verrucomicrobiota bacterium]
MKRFLQRFGSSRTWIVLGLLLSLCPLFAQTNISIGPPPDWVQPVRWDATAQRPPQEKSEGVRYLLDERQEHPQREEEFVRTIELMENEAGVQDSGSLAFYFDPSYQQLIIHQVQIHRGGQVLNRLDSAKLKTIQSEPDLNGHMLTGEQSAVLFVEDLRVGDVLEYSYTRRGYNPILGGHYSTRFGVQFGSPVDRQRIRVLWTAAKPLHVRTHLAASTPARKLSNGITEYLWDFTNLTAIEFEDYLPASYEPYPYVELSDFKDWARVVDWALPLYPTTPTNLPAELQQLIEEWQRTGPTDEERARLALEFVQDELRYTGLELGPDSYRPTPAAETFQKRFGDCKGKTLLLCTILHAMNFEAWPALVNTADREAIAPRLPSPFAFNHVIVKLRLGGKTFWLDPTYSHQGGALAKRFLPRLGKALVIQPGGTALEDVPLAAADSTRQRVQATFRITDYQSPTTLTVQTTYRGYGADDMREDIARSDLKELGKDYLNYYARLYPSIASAQPLSVSDDRKANVLTINETYSIKDLWKLDTPSKKWQAEFYGESLVNLLTDPTTRLRKMPLRIPFPLRQEHEITVHLPDRDWEIPSADKTIEHEAFSFRARRNFTGKVLRYQFECETKVSELPPQKVADYLIKLDEMETALGESLERPDNTPHHFTANLNWLMIVIAVFGGIFTLAGVCLGWFLTRSRNVASPGEIPPLLDTAPQLRGLSGWLILVGFGLCLSLPMRGYFLLSNWDGYFSIQVWQNFAMPQSDRYHPGYAPLLIYELLGNIAIIGLNVLTIGLFFMKRKAFPRVFLLFLWTNAFLIVSDELICRQIPFLAKESSAASTRLAIRAVFYAVLWTAYTLKSRRVRATFIH